MKKSRFILIVNISVVALMPLVYAQESSRLVDEHVPVSKQQLEDFLSGGTDTTQDLDLEQQSDASNQDEAISSDDIYEPELVDEIKSTQTVVAEAKEPATEEVSVTQTAAQTAQPVEAATPALPTQAVSAAPVAAMPVAPTPVATGAPVVPVSPAQVTTVTSTAPVVALPVAPGTPVPSAAQPLPTGTPVPVAGVPAAPVAVQPVTLVTPVPAVAPGGVHVPVQPAPVIQPVAAQIAPAVVQPVPVAVQPVAVPKAPVEAPAPMPEKQPEESLLDTIDIEEGGNWVLKRKALQDTVRKIEDINALYDDIRDTNIVFLQGVNTVDVMFTQFSYDVGLDLGKVDQLVQDVAQYLETEREESGDFTEAEKELFVKAEERKKEIEQLRANINDIWQAYDQIKEARALNDEQIIEADRLRKQAWRNFRMIERVLNEEKAEEKYHETVQLFEAMQASYRYLQTRLIPHFEQSIKIIQNKMQTVKQQSEELQNQGVLLKQEAIQLDQTQKEETEFVKEQPEPSTGWFERVKNILLAPFRAIGSLWNSITGSSANMDQYLPDVPENDMNKDHEIQHADEV